MARLAMKMRRVVIVATLSLLSAIGPGYHFLPNCTCRNEPVSSATPLPCSICAAGADRADYEKQPQRMARAHYPCAVRRHLAIVASLGVDGPGISELMPSLPAETSTLGCHGLSPVNSNGFIRGPPFREPSRS